VIPNCDGSLAFSGLGATNFISVPRRLATPSVWDRFGAKPPYVEEICMGARIFNPPFSNSCFSTATKYIEFLFARVPSP